jgi:membrane-associated protease RseP (regulator of RpoE activity)
MELWESVLIVLAVFAAYFGALFFLYRTGRIGPERTFSFFGPALMIKTRRGRTWLDRAGRFQTFWSAVADLGVILAALAMITIVLLLAWEGVLATRIPASAAPSPTEALGIPGLNPIIPLGYGIVALAVGIVLHELAHGVVARSQKVGVKSIGILWFVVPVGAFVEQDEAEMNGATRRRRTRIAAAGVLANFFLAVVFFLLLAAVVGSTVHPAANGVGVAEVISDTPAGNSSLTAGDIITNVNGTPTPDFIALSNALANTTPGETVSVTYYQGSTGTMVTIHPTLTKNPYGGKEGFLGVGATFLTPTQTVQELVWPPGSSYGPLIGGEIWIVLPLAGLEPMSGPATNFFHLSGPLAGLGTNGFWILANLLFWLSWMNLLLGLSNALPLIPLDGGLLFRDFMASILSRLKRGWTVAHLDDVAGRLAVGSTFVVLFLLAWQFIAPHL